MVTDRGLRTLVEQPRTLEDACCLQCAYELIDPTAVERPAETVPSHQDRAGHAADSAVRSTVADPRSTTPRTKRERPGWSG